MCAAVLLVGCCVCLFCRVVFVASCRWLLMSVLFCDCLVFVLAVVCCLVVGCCFLGVCPSSSSCFVFCYVCAVLEVLFVVDRFCFCVLV